MTFRDSIVQPFQPSFMPTGAGRLSDLAPLAPSTEQGMRRLTAVWSPAYSASVRRVESGIVVAMMIFFGMGLLAALNVL